MKLLNRKSCENDNGCCYNGHSKFFSLFQSFQCFNRLLNRNNWSWVILGMDSLGQRSQPELLFLSFILFIIFFCGTAEGTGSSQSGKTTQFPPIRGTGAMPELRWALAAVPLHLSLYIRGFKAWKKEDKKKQPHPSS